MVEREMRVVLGLNGEPILRRVYRWPRARRDGGRPPDRRVDRGPRRRPRLFLTGRPAATGIPDVIADALPPGPRRLRDRMGSRAFETAVDWLCGLPVPPSSLPSSIPPSGTLAGAAPPASSVPARPAEPAHADQEALARLDRAALRLFLLVVWLVHAGKTPHQRAARERTSRGRDPHHDPGGRLRLDRRGAASRGGRPRLLPPP